MPNISTFTTLKPSSTTRSGKTRKRSVPFRFKLGVKAVATFLVFVNLILFFSVLLGSNMYLGLAYEQGRLNNDLNKHRASQQELQAMVAERSSVSRAQNSLAVAGVGYVAADYSEILSVAPKGPAQVSLR